MKKYIIIFLLCAAPLLAKCSKLNYMINLQDTVVFDLSQAVCASGTMQFPVFILSDEPVYALDFSLKFNPGNLTYLSVTDLQPYLGTSAYFNASDSTLRFSSFSIQPMDNNTPLVMLRFNLPSAQINLADFDSVYTLLNGDNCSKKFINPVLPLNVAVSGSTVIDPGDSLMLSVNFISGVNYLWSTGETSTAIYINTPGIYTVTVASIMGCISLSSIEITAPSPLPVELIRFEALRKESGIELSWTTASEVYNDYFEVQRTDDAGNWKNLGRIDGAGISGNINNYDFMDHSPMEGANYYRLMQMDYDGAFSYSWIQKVDFSKVHKNHALIAFPNPVGQDKRITFGYYEEMQMDGVVIIIFDSKGNEVTDFKYEGDMKGGNGNQITVKLPYNLTAGLYTAQIISGGINEICRFTVY